MSRKLKRKRKVQHIDSTEEKDVLKKKRVIKRFRKQKCAYIKDGKRCCSNAVGKSTLCKKHGGNPVVEDNLLKQNEMHLDVLNTKYNPETHPVLFMDLSRMGLSDVEIAAEFSIGIGTLRSWSEKYKMFSKAYEIGQALYESWWLQQGRNGLTNRGFNTSLFKFLTGNKLGYSEKMESKNLNMNIHGVLMVPDKMTDDEWEKEEDIIDVDS